MIKKFFSYYKPHMRLFIIDLSCAFAVALCNLLYPFLTQKIIKTYVPNKQLNMLLIVAAVLLGIYVLKAFLNYIIQYWGHVFGVRIQGDMRNELFRHLQKLPFRYYDETKTGSIMSRLINDLFEVSELAHHGPEDLFISTISIIGALIMILMINPILSLIIFLIIPFIIIFATKMQKELMDAFRKTREQTAEINSGIESSVSGIRVTKAYTAQEHEIEKFGRYNDNYQSARNNALKKMGKFHSVMSFFMDFLYLVALVCGGLFFYFDKIDVADLTAFILYITMLISPIRTLVSIFEQIQSGMTGFVRFREVMDIAEEVEPENPIYPSKIEGNVEFDNVKFKYNADGDSQDFVLDNFSLKIKAGEKVALVGPSGAGKTTVCHLLMRFYLPTEGKIFIDGINIADMTSTALRKNIGIVAQDVFLFSGTVKENIAYGDFDADDDKIIAAAKLANIDKFIDTLPNGYDTYVGERGVKLSGGQKQRIAIARAFLKNPPILILDEATSSLDNVTETQIQNSLDELCKGRTTVIVAHRLSTIKNADEIIVIDNEGVAERGSHDRLLEKGGLYAELYNMQFKNM